MMSNQWGQRPFPIKYNKFAKGDCRMNENIYSRFKQYVAKNMNLRLYDIAFNRGDKQYLFDIENKKYLDMFSGATTAILGYNNQEIINEYVKTCGKLHHTCSVYTPTEEIVDLAKKLVDIVPSSGSNKTIFGLSGSDAIECSIKAARKYTNRKDVICFDKAYHGSCGLSISATRWDSLQEGLLLDKDFIAFSYPKSKEEGEIILSEIIKSSKQELPAAIVMESIQGDGGMFLADKDFLISLSEFCLQKEIILIIDEIQSGMSRTGKWWGYEHTGIAPDMVVIGKATSAGYGVLSAVIGRDAVLDSLDKGQHVFTYSASPHACSVCSKVIEIIERENYPKKNEENGFYFFEKLRKISSPLIVDIRGIGLMIGLEIRKQENINAGLVGLRCSEKGVYFGYYGQNNEILRIHPPYIINERDIDFACEVIEDTLQEITTGKIPSETYAKFEKVCVGLGE